MESQWGNALALNLVWLLFLILGLVLTVQVITEPWKLQNSFLGIYIIPGFILVTLLLLLPPPSVDHNPGHCWLPGKISSVQFSCSVVSDSLQPHELQHASLPYHQLLELAQTHAH